MVSCYVSPNHLHGGSYPICSISIRHDATFWEWLVNILHVGSQNLLLVPLCILVNPGPCWQHSEANIIVEHLKSTTKFEYLLPQGIHKELSHDIYYNIKQQNIMLSDSISATCSRCSPRSLTPLGHHSSLSWHPHLHRTRKYKKIIAMSTLRTQHVLPSKETY